MPTICKTLLIISISTAHVSHLKSKVYLLQLKTLLISLRFAINGGRGITGVDT
jgi:hypothetical protein